MKRGTRHLETDLAVIGTGIAGFAASLFARKRGLAVAQFGHSGAMAYTTGYLDLLGVADGKAVRDPWAALDALRLREPDHPLTRVPNGEIRQAIGEFIDWLNEAGLGYTDPSDRNLSALLPNGVTKTTLCVPRTMHPGIEARAARAKTLVLDFEGLQGFSARAFAVNFAAEWPELRAARLTFPGMENAQVFAEVMARAMETAEVREQLAALIRPLLGDAEYIGLPAILGMQAPDRTRAQMEELLGVTVFEIPTIPPAVAGIRLRECFERRIPDFGVALEPQLKVSQVCLTPSGAELSLHGAMEDIIVQARCVILATGRFLSGGLAADRSRVFETLLGLPLRQPEGRDGWFRDGYLDPRGHPINRLGIDVDARFRPTRDDGSPFDDRLFAAGSILARQDWVRQRCGAGLAITSAFAAVDAAATALD